MKKSHINQSLRDRVGEMVTLAETVCETDPDLCESATMVFVGDVYSLREELTGGDTAWGERCYTCNPGQDPL